MFIRIGKLNKGQPNAEVLNEVLPKYEALLNVKEHSHIYIHQGMYLPSAEEHEAYRFTCGDSTIVVHQHPDMIERVFVEPVLAFTKNDVILVPNEESGTDIFIHLSIYQAEAAINPNINGFEDFSIEECTNAG